ncbi:dsDNA nuclease domain-containing protein [Sphingobacterium sp. SGL-16]|uniref:dsDNA nuclease domain-containing protein n=1 Tax=Sphingobacterium sp. SGL-16 TaxID=2710883 RepID=UPI0013EC167A|nr:dsDNA nuclease domain-containing protein [Sphingobacterium sp. SGL-16]NGM74264.1 DUF4297 domain-containing protein [Sphingobacterium sp. SGL-16]
MKALKPELVNSYKNIGPDSVVDSKDPGDDVLRRFRYQITYTGILCLKMINQIEFEELFCEHHEDLLVKYKDGTYTGIQIKTKELNLPPFKIDDDSIIKSFKRFIILDMTFPGKFRTFSIVSNHGFDQSKPHLCINTLIENIKQGNDVLKPRSKTLTLIKGLCKDTGCDEEHAKNVIAKIRLRTFCGLDDINMKLHNELKNCKILKGLTESKLLEIGDLIIAKCFHASSLTISDDDPIISYISGKSELADIAAQIITDKCIKLRDFQSWLESEKITPAVLLLKDREHKINSTDGYRRLEIKMDAGEIDADNISIIKDFKFAFEQHSLAWMYKDSEDADLKYSQIMSVTQNLCKEIYDEKKIGQGEKTGQEMLIAVRREIKNRKANDPKIFLDCTYEHIIGAVGVLTESCKVWWTPKFDIK